MCLIKLHALFCFAIFLFCISDSTPGLLSSGIISLYCSFYVRTGMFTRYCLTNQMYDYVR